MIHSGGGRGSQRTTERLTFNLSPEECLGSHLAEKTKKKIPDGKRLMSQNSELRKNIMC